MLRWFRSLFFSIPSKAGFLLLPDKSACFPIPAAYIFFSCDFPFYKSRKRLDFTKFVPVKKAKLFFVYKVYKVIRFVKYFINFMYLMNFIN